MFLSIIHSGQSKTHWHDISLVLLAPENGYGQVVTTIPHRWPLERGYWTMNDLTMRPPSKTLRIVHQTIQVPIPHPPLFPNPTLATGKYHFILHLPQSIFPSKRQLHSQWGLDCGDNRATTGVEIPTLKFRTMLYRGLHYPPRHTGRSACKNTLANWYKDQNQLTLVATYKAFITSFSCLVH